MNRAFLTMEGNYYASFKSTNILNGAIKEVLVINPISEIKEQNNASRKQLALTNRKIAAQRIEETDGEEKEKYTILLNESNDELDRIAKKRYYNKVKKLRCRIIANVIRDYYQIEVLLPKSWQEDYKYVFETLDEKERKNL
jgi:hypothetical protein